MIVHYNTAISHPVFHFIYNLLRHMMNRQGSIIQCNAPLFETVNAKSMQVDASRRKWVAKRNLSQTQVKNLR